MKRVTLGIFAAFLVLAAPVAPTAPRIVDAAAEKEAIRKVIHASIGWAMTKDFVLLYGSLAQDPELFLFQPTSTTTIIGFEAFQKFAEAHWRTEDFKATGYEFREVRIHLSRSGDVAWFSAILDDCGEFKGQAGCWKDTRYTGVLEKRRGKWVLCQMHFSFAADKVLEESRRATKEQQIP